MNRVLAALLVIALLGACAPSTDQIPPLDQDKLNADIDAQIGGLGTCVVLADVKTGAEVYRYGHIDVCDNPLPPCATFEIANDLIGLDLGVITPQALLKWDGTPQPIKEWQVDADLAYAFKNSVVWWQQRVARAIGRDRYAKELEAFGYGSKTPAGPLDGFWLGPAAGGGLGISTRQQVDFLKRLYDGRARVNPANAGLVEALMADETRTDAKGGKAMISGKPASCATMSDGSRNVGWWIGRLQTPTRDLVFAASVDGAAAPPGIEVERRLKDVFADAGLWPAG